MFKPYTYVKRESLKAVEGSEIVIRLPKPKLPAVDFRTCLPAGRRWASVLLVAGGVFLFTSQILLPWLATPSAQKPLLKPVSSGVLGTDKIMLPPEGRAGERNFVKVEFEFTELKQQETEQQGGGVAPGNIQKNVPEVFYITIPELGIEKAEVETNSQDLSPDERLGHYPGSALPGEAGNTFIYGHSVLPMFYDPKNYRAIFSTLDKLEEGDEVRLEFGEQHFKYAVEGSVVLKPEDVRPLEPVSPPSLGDSYLTLMTCVPMGLGTDRLLVQARLVFR